MVMGMIDITHFTRMPVERLNKLNNGDRIELLTYKKDRKVVIIKVDADSCDVEEDGFEIKTFSGVEISKLSKLLKQLEHIEFPRSKKFFMNIFQNRAEQKSLELKY